MNFIFHLHYIMGFDKLVWIVCTKNIQLLGAVYPFPSLALQIHPTVINTLASSHLLLCFWLFPLCLLTTTCWQHSLLGEDPSVLAPWHTERRVQKSFYLLVPVLRGYRVSLWRILYPCRLMAPSGRGVATRPRAQSPRKVTAPWSMGIRSRIMSL